MINVALPKGRLGEKVYKMFAKSIRRIKTENVPNSRYKSAVFYNRSSNEYVKVLLDYKGNIIAENTLSSELDNGGTQRDSYFINMASMGLQKIPGLVANDPD